MTSDDFEYIWEHVIIKTANDVIRDINTTQSSDLLQLSVDEDVKERVYNAYQKHRYEIKARYFDVGDERTNLMDVHKICSCIAGALIQEKIVRINPLNAEEIPVLAGLSNYAIAFLSSVHFLYISLLSNYLKTNDQDAYNLLDKQATILFPQTNEGHDEYVMGRIKALALNDAYNNKLDVLAFADMMFWIELYNRKHIEEMKNH